VPVGEWKRLPSTDLERGPVQSGEIIQVMHEGAYREATFDGVSMGLRGTLRTPDRTPIFVPQGRWERVSE